MLSFRRRTGTTTAAAKTDRVGNFFFRIFGPATVEGAIQGWSPEAREQYKRMRESWKRPAGRDQAPCQPSSP